MTIRSATCNDEMASLALHLSNPGGRDLTVTRLAYDISHGESSFPVATGEWTGDVSLPAHGDATIPLVARFDVPPIEPGSRLLHVSGELFLIDRTGFLGLSAMDLTRTSFRAEVQATGGAS